MPQVYLPTVFLNSEQKGRDVRTIEVNLDRGLFLPEAERAYCQIGQACLPYSFINISAELYNNAGFSTVTIPGLEVQGYQIPEGCYTSLTELEAGMNKALSPAYDPDNPASQIIFVRGNTVTNQVEIRTISTFNRDIIIGEGLARELGFPNGTQISPGTSTSPPYDWYTSSLPVIFNDIIASGILVICEGDLQVMSFFQNIDNSNCMAQVPLNNTDIPGGVINYPRDVLPINLPVVNGKTVRKFKIRFISPRDPERDFIWLQGDASIVINFFTIY